MSEATILLLAAGRSTRMRGADKLLEEVPGPFGPMPLLQAMARRAAQAGPTRVVLGPGQEARRACLSEVDAEIVEAPEGEGMAVSIATGVAGLNGPVMVVLTDMPEVRASDLHLILTLGQQAPDAILRAAGADGTPGHPVLFPADLLPELAALTGDTGARDVLKRHGARVHLVPLEGSRALVDLDTPEDWAAWRTGAEDA